MEYLLRKPFVALLGLLLIFQAHAQTDSLQQAFEQQVASGQKMDAFATGDLLASSYSVENDIGKGTPHAFRLLDFVKSEFKGRARDSLMAIAYDQVAVILGSDPGPPNQAKSYLDSAVVLMEEFGMWNRAAHVYSNKATFLNRLSQYAEAITYLIKAQDTILEHDVDGNDSYTLWSIYLNLATGHRNLAQYNEELTYALKSYESLDPDQPEKSDDVLYRLGYSYQLIAIAYSNLKELDQAKSYVKKGIAIFEKTGQERAILDLNNTLATINKEHAK